MSLPLDPKPVSFAKCEACGAKADCEVWDRAVCYPCATNWFENTPDYGVLAAQLGPNFNLDEKYQGLASAWLEKRQREARVA